jgi:hypothetical protein
VHDQDMACSHDAPVPFLNIQSRIYFYFFQFCFIEREIYKECQRPNFYSPLVQTDSISSGLGSKSKLCDWSTKHRKTRSKPYRSISALLFSWFRVENVSLWMSHETTRSMCMCQSRNTGTLCCVFVPGLWLFCRKLEKKN